jgi:predicted aspartyl protease
MNDASFLSLKKIKIKIIIIVNWYHILSLTIVNIAGKIES